MYHFDNLYYLSGGKFPYRRYIHGSSYVEEYLSYLINNYEPEYENNITIHSSIKSKVKSRMKEETVFDFFDIGPKKIKKPDDWKYDSIVDYYTDNSRMASIGYGKQYSPLDFWENNTFNSQKKNIFNGKKTILEAKEAIYNEFKASEVRLAYVSESIGLLKNIRKYIDNNSPRMLDITAFGDRLIAAAAAGYKYTGVDPDSNLVDGINRLILDVQSINRNFKCNTYTLPIEHYSPLKLFDLITLSPPPFDMELYEGGERQTHRVYRDFKHWFYGFIRETLTRAYLWLRDGGIFAFTVLDREGIKNIQYTEAMIMLAMSLGFEPLELYSLSSGTPWWIFRKTNKYDTRIYDFYPELIINKSINNNNHPAMEYIRLLTQRYLVSILERSNFFNRPEKTMDIIGRMLMSKTPSSEEPDILFMDEESDYCIDINDFNRDWIPSPFILQTADQGYRTVIYPEGKSMKEILGSLFNAITSYLHWIQCTVKYETFERKVKVDKYTTKFGNFINLFVDHKDIIGTMNFLRSQTLFTEKELDNIKINSKNLILWSTKDPYATVKNISSWIRYDAVGSVGHHYTRPVSRINAIKEISKDDKIVDLFATPSNANTPYYTSVFPDVDPGSLGNFLTYNGSGFKTFMANPPPVNSFSRKVYEKFKDIYLDGDKRLFYSTTIWNDNGSKYLDRLRNKENPYFDDLENYYLPTVLSEEKSLLAIYIVSHDLHPGYDPVNKRTLKQRDSESVGFIFGNIKDFDFTKLELLSGGNHYIF